MSDQYERLMMVVNRYGLESYRIGRDRGDGKLEQPAAKNAAFTAVEREARILEAAAKVAAITSVPCQSPWVEDNNIDCLEARELYQRDKLASGKFPMCERCERLDEAQRVLAALIQQREEG